MAWSSVRLVGKLDKQVVRGVSHSLHSPLMAVTNAISGLTALGGMYLLGPGLVPHTKAELLGAGAVLISTVNISGGFLASLCHSRKEDVAISSHQ